MFEPYRETVVDPFHLNEEAFCPVFLVSFQYILEAPANKGRTKDTVIVFSEIPLPTNIVMSEVFGLLDKNLGL